MSASVFSQMAEMLLIEEIRCARNALATSFDSSALHTLLVMMFFLSTQCAYRSTSDFRAASPVFVS